MRKRYGKDWASKPKQGRFGRDCAAILDILKRADAGDWFEYPQGSALHYFRFPERYQAIARDGVPIFFTEPGPSEMRAQTPLKPEEKAILAEKLTKVIWKGYLAIPDRRLRSLIKYFAVPKGILEGLYRIGA